MSFIKRVFSNYVHNKMTKEESNSLILGTFNILSDDFRSDEQKIKMIEDIYKKIFLNHGSKEHSK